MITAAFVSAWSGALYKESGTVYIDIAIFFSVWYSFNAVRRSMFFTTGVDSSDEARYA